ncbi:hypothetical protein LUZ60_012165 [Juncus effusus]|nr:hypothetical protein LUZ60_012165 [Juncus effusus]
MMRRGNNNGSRETVNAAAEAIVQAENRTRQVEVSQRRNPKCLPCFPPCFFSSCTQTNRPKKINQAALAPLPSPSQPIINHPNPSQPNPPPSSPASSLSLLQSEPNSINHSPSSAFSFGPYSIGPFAHETQLVSPPVFSTEPSTAPFTPPPESVQLILTSPNSPEVPFARFLTRLDPNGGNQISPKSVCSSNDNSSPCGKGLDLNLNLNFPIRESPRLIGVEGFSARKSMPFHARKDGSLLDGRISAKEFEIECDELERREAEQNGDVKEKLEVDQSEPSVFKFDNSEGNNSNGKNEVTKNWPFFPLETNEK